MSVQGTWAQRITRTQAIMSAAWRILKEDKTLLLLPIASSACLFLIMASYLGPLMMEVATGDSVAEGVRRVQPSSEVEVFLLSVMVYAIGIYFNAALAICVLGRLERKTPTILDGVKGALSCLPQIVGWAVVSSTVGLLLRAVERRSGFVGRLVVTMVGMAWSVATFLVVPVLVAERKGPVEAVQESVQLLRWTWGEDLLAGLGFGALYFLWSIPGWLAFVMGAGLIPTHPFVAILVLVSALAYFPLLGLVFSTLSTIFDVVLYRYAKLGTITPGFDRALLESSFVARPSAG